MKTSDQIGLVTGILSKDPAILFAIDLQRDPLSRRQRERVQKQGLMKRMSG